MDQVIALPVSGDAFFRTCRGKTILIDGGGSGAKLARCLYNHCDKINHLNIVVCTHKDADHSKGLADFVSVYKEMYKIDIVVEEFWLPGRWSNLTGAGKRNLDEVADRFFCEVDEFFGVISKNQRQVLIENGIDADTWISIYKENNIGQTINNKARIKKIRDAKKSIEKIKQNVKRRILYR